MSRRTQRISALLAAGYILSLILLDIHAGAQTPNDKPIPLMDYLAQIGKDHDCFFTIEQLLNEKDDPGNTIAGHWVHPASFRDCLHALEPLRRISNFSYRIDPTNSRIIHIIDLRLLAQRNYALEAVIEHINYEGKLGDLPAAIGKTGIGVSSPLVTFTGETTDYKTTVAVAGERLNVRKALSDFIPLAGRTNHILWTATTRFGERMTYVRFP